MTVVNDQSLMSRTNPTLLKNWLFTLHHFIRNVKIVHVENNNSTTHINYDTEKNVRVRKIFVCQKQNKNHRISDLP